MRKISSSNFENEVFLEQQCILNKVVKLIGSRWTASILLLIEKKIHRFSELKKGLKGVSDNVLSNNLNQLVRSGLLKKNIYQQVPLKVEYKLTEKGITMVQLLHGLCKWGKLHIEK